MGGFNDIERALKRAAERAIKVRAEDMQRLFDQLGRELKGQPLDLAKLRLQSEWSKGGGSITEPRLTAYATALVEGRRFEVTTESVRW